ncbi:MAG: magnesium chelatase domain-containing protein [Nitrososphaera sp.]
MTINLAPADLPKEGGRFDLPIALGVLAASQQIPAPALETIEFVGELALTGELRAIRGALPCALQAQRAGHNLVVLTTTQTKRPWVNDLSVFPARYILEVAPISIAPSWAMKRANSSTSGACRFRPQNLIARLCRAQARSSSY